MEPVHQEIERLQHECTEGETRCRRVIAETCATADRVADALESQGKQLKRVNNIVNDTNHTLIQANKVAHRMRHWWITRKLFKRWRDPVKHNPNNTPEQTAHPGRPMSVRPTSDDPFADEMLESIGHLKQVATAIGHELDEHNQLLVEISSRTDDALVRTKATTATINKMLY